MKFHCPWNCTAALIVASPVAFAQNTGYSGHHLEARRERSKGRHEPHENDQALKEAHGQLQA